VASTACERCGRRRWQPATCCSRCLWALDPTQRWTRRGAVHTAPRTGLDGIACGGHRHAAERQGAPDAAQALADVATIALIQDRAAADSNLVNEQLQNALDSRVILEQAKGVLSFSGDLDMPAAYSALRQ